MTPETSNNKFYLKIVSLSIAIVLMGAVLYERPFASAGSEIIISIIVLMMVVVLYERMKDR